MEDARTLRPWSSPLFNVLAFSVFWAAQVLVTKLAFLKGAPLFPFIIQSAFFSILLMTGLVLPRHYRHIRTVPRSILLGVLGANAIHFGLGGFFSSMGTARTSATNAAFTMQFSTVTTTLMAWLVLGEPLTRSKVATVALIMVGSFLLLTNGLVTPPGAGELLVLLACISWSTGNVGIRWLLRKGSMRSDVIACLRPVVGLPIFVALLEISHLWAGDRLALGEGLCDLSCAGYAAVNGACLSLLWIFLNRTLEVASASYMTAMCSVTPVFVAALAIPLFGERLSLVQVLGAGLIVSSSFLVQRLKF
jgi:drug/metabolite transporter (DMT)-like permease